MPQNGDTKKRWRNATARRRARSRVSTATKMTATERLIASRSRPPRPADVPIADAVAIGDRILSARVARGWSQLDLALRTGLWASKIGHLERGERLASLSDTIALAYVLDIPLLDLILGDTPRRLKDRDLPGETPHEKQII